MAGRRARLDAELVRRGLASSRTEAQRLIADRAVTVQGVPMPKPATQIGPDQAVTLVDTGPRYASRGGLKLAGALEDLGVDPRGLVALDAGAAHGGFTDVLLRHGASHVIAVDVAYGQLDWALRNDERVTLLERTNVRHLQPEDLPGPAPSLVVADLSFIALAKVLPALAALATPDAAMLPMVKPQFEAGPAHVGRGGVVRDPEVWIMAMSAVAETARELGFVCVGAAPSQAPGPAGNVEFFLHLVRPSTGAADPAPHFARAAEAGLALRDGEG